MTGKKRPHSPGGDNSENNDNSTQEPVSKGTGTPALCLVRHLTYCTEKQHKKAQQELKEEQESDGEGTTKRSKSDVHPVPDCLLILIVSQASAPMLIVPSICPLYFLLVLSLIPPLIILGAKKSMKPNTTNKVGKKQPPKPKPSKSDSSSLSDPDNEFNKAAEKSSDEDDPDVEEDDLDVAGMTMQDALKLLDDEVQFFLPESLSD